VSARVPAERPVLQVGPDHPGVSEAAWATSRPLGRLDPLVLPDVDAVVVVAPHPDDEILGSGGLLQLLTAAGSRVEICAVTDGEAFVGGGDRSVAELRQIRSDESSTALVRLGLGHAVRTRLGHPDGGVEDVEDRVAAHLTDRLHPRVLCLAPWRFDGHPDHDACGRAAARAARSTGATLLEYPVWAWHWARPDGDDLPWSACRRLELERPVVAAKRWAIGAFRSQVATFDARGTPPVLPPAVVRRFTRAFEVFIE
jgi:LmbE family N-acetylglucosaminyl deacetylase